MYNSIGSEIILEVLISQEDNSWTDISLSVIFALHREGIIRMVDGEDFSL